MIAWWRSQPGHSRIETSQLYNITHFALLHVYYQWLWALIASAAIAKTPFISLHVTIAPDVLETKRWASEKTQASRQGACARAVEGYAKHWWDYCTQGSIDFDKKYLDQLILSPVDVHWYMSLQLFEMIVNKNECYSLTLYCRM